MDEQDKPIGDRIQSWILGEGGCIFRGQSICSWPVTSTLHRAYSKSNKKKSLLRLEKNVLAAAQYRIWPHASEPEIFADLQHVSGMSNYIDFTRNVHVAVYFACAHNLHEDGAVYFLKSQALPTLHPFEFGVEFCKDLGMNASKQEADLAVALPGVSQANFNRVLMQESIFIQAKGGYIDCGRFFKIETIKAKDKLAALAYVEDKAYLSHETLFGDVLALAEKDSTFEPRYKPKRYMQLKLEQYDGLKKESERWGHRAKNTLGWILPRFMNQGYSHYRLGRVHYSCGKYVEAEGEFRKALKKGCNDSVQEKVLMNLASTYLRLGHYREALGCLSKVRHYSYRELCHFMAAEAHFRMKRYEKAWNRINEAVYMNRYRLTYLRLKTAIAFKLGKFEKAVECATIYLSYYLWDEQIITIRAKAREAKQATANLPDS